MRLVWFFLASCMALGFLVAAPDTAQADVTLNPPDDSFVSAKSGEGDTNFDNHADGLRVTAFGPGVPPAVVEDITYLRFDVSGLSGTLTAARLRLYNVDPNQYTSSVGLYSTDDDDWNGASSGLGDETTITYNNAPAEDSLLDTQAELSGWMEWSGTNLTNYVSGQLTSGLVTLRLKEQLTLGLAFVSIYEDHENNNGSGNTAQLILEGLNDGTPVVLEGLTAKRLDQGVRLSWSTVSEHKHAGFRVLREGAGGRVVTVTPELIRPAAAGGELAGADYEFVDLYAGPMLQKYWLDDVDTMGRVTRHGPVFASPIEFSPFRLLSTPRLYPGAEAVSGFGR